jgi:hypothetical protein
MPLIDRLKNELDRAGRAAQDALDEGRLRLELFRAKQTADRSAQKLGYAVYKAKRAGNDLTNEQYAAFAADLTSAEAEVHRYETLLAELSVRKGGSSKNLPVKAE